MEDFKKEFIEDIVVEKVNLLRATHIEVKPFWDRLEADKVFDGRKIIIDLSFCTLINTTFAGIIVKAFRKIAENNGEMKLVLPQFEAENLFRLSGLTQLIDSFHNLDDAIESYNLNSPINEVQLSG